MNCQQRLIFFPFISVCTLCLSRHKYKVKKYDYSMLLQYLCLHGTKLVILLNMIRRTAELEASGRGYWETSEENLERLRELYSEVEDKIEGIDR